MTFEVGRATVDLALNKVYYQTLQGSHGSSGAMTLGVIKDSSNFIYGLNLL